MSIEELTVDEIHAAPGVNVLLLSDRQDADAFFTLEGELRLRLGEDTHRLEPETWVLVPPTGDYSIAADETGPARFLHIQLPSSESAGEVVIRRAGGAEGERITDLPERRATVLVETDDVTISEFRYGAGERGAKLHVHHEHADGFLVLEGEFTFHFRDGSRALPARTLLVIPPGVVHGFDNDSDAHARCFNFHIPSFGFADYMRGRKPDFDQHDPPEDGGVDPAAVVLARLAK